MGRRMGWTAVAIVVAAATVLALVLIRRSPTRHQADPPPPPTRSTQAVAPPASPVAKPKPAVPHQHVAAAAPTSFEMKGPKFDIKAHVCSMPYIRPLDPPGEQHHTVCWVENDFGVAPGNPSKGTSYIAGHAWAEDDQEVLNPMSELAMKQVDQSRPEHESGVPIFPVTDMNGYSVRLHTAKGTLTYRVTRTFAVSKDQAANVASVMDEKVPNRIVIITCGVKNGQDIDVNIISYAMLVSSVAA